MTSAPGTSVLAFDIETEGLDPLAHGITCVCVAAGGASRSFVFPGGDLLEAHAGRRAEVLALLDGAGRLCAYNGVRFDVPFIAARWAVGAGRVGGWVAKLWDLCSLCSLCFGRAASLDGLLRLNGFESKSGSGARAVELARDGRWDELAEYCARDARLTLELTCSRGGTRLPRWMTEPGDSLSWTFHPRL